VQQLLEGLSLPDLRVDIIWHAFGNECKAVQRTSRLLGWNLAETATGNLLAYQDTVDAYWVGQTRAAFDLAKSSHVEAVIGPARGKRALRL
jgi:hypothetical protein